eukprot:15267-Heterococcus_DN1.PRE.3
MKLAALCALVQWLSKVAYSKQELYYIGLTLTFAELATLNNACAAYVKHHKRAHTVNTSSNHRLSTQAVHIQSDVSL